MTVLDGISLGDTAIPYVAALDGALRAGGLWEDDTAMLAGLTGLAFHLVVDPKTCPASPTAYYWSGVHATAVERLGIGTRCVECVGRVEVYPERRDEAVAMIKASLDQGRPAVVRTVDWAEFAIVVGYDDEDGVLFYDDRHADPILYDNLGSPHGFPFLFAQVFDSPAAFDLPRAAQSALAYAVTCWTGEGFQKHRWYDFAVGAEGYAALIRALESRATDPLGLRYTVKIHADGRSCVQRFVRRLVADEVLPGLERVADVYDEVAPLVGRVAELLPSAPPFERPVEIAPAADAARLLSRAADLERTAIEAIAAMHLMDD